MNISYNKKVYIIISIKYLIRLIKFKNNSLFKKVKINHDDSIKNMCVYFYSSILKYLESEIKRYLEVSKV